MSEVIHPFLEALQEMQGGSLFRSCLMEEKARGCKYWMTTSMANRVPSIAAVRSTVIRFLDILAPAFPYQGLSSCLLPKQADLISVQHISGLIQRQDLRQGVGLVVLGILHGGRGTFPRQRSIDDMVAYPERLYPTV